MRLFVAVLPPPGALAELETAVAPLRSGWPALRWAGGERWHVTLAFLGEVAEEGQVLDNLGERLERAARRYEAMPLSIGHGGAFPSPKRAQVLIAHVVAEDQARLAALAASVAAGARRAGAPPPDEGRRYRPHLTLARSRQPADLRALVDSLSGFRGRTWRPGRVELIRSETGPRPRYVTIGTWPLRGAGAPDAPDSAG
ncbi:MAG TPA: RNA 2',3'-cyclic phosphodiesterase [Streptosporangiaceae bacterium]